MLRRTMVSRAASAFFMPTTSFVGAGALDMTLPKIQALGFKKALLVSDKGLEKTGLVTEVAASLATVGIQTSLFTDVQPNPTVTNVNEGLARLEKEKCNCIISLGGGSVHDCAKGIALVKTNGGKIEDYEGVDVARKPQFPLMSINTTAGTASEMTRFVIVTDETRHVKMAIATDYATPLIAVSDAVMMVKQPAALTAATGMDALTHAVEAFVSTAASPITDSAAEKAIVLIGQHLRAAVRDGMAYAQFLAGMAFNSASLGYVHAMAHQHGGVYNLPHGVCNAILLPHVQEFNLPACAGRLRTVGALLGASVAGRSEEEGAHAALAAIRQLSQDVGIPSGFWQLGVKEEDLPMLAERALQDICGLTNPRRATKEEIVAIYRAAM